MLMFLGKPVPLARLFGDANAYGLMQILPKGRTLVNYQRDHQYSSSWIAHQSTRGSPRFMLLNNCPGNCPSANWVRIPCRAAYFWSEIIKWRLANQVDRIRHWTITEGSWEQA